MIAADSRHELALSLLRAGLASVEGRPRVREALASGADTPDGPVWAAAIGKAAASMVLGANDALGESLERVLLITKRGHLEGELRSLRGLEALESGHPLPDERSLRAGARLIEWVDALPAHVSPLFLISGGASSLVEVLAPGATLAELVRVSAAGLARGLEVAALNAERARLSRIKGGQLAARMAGRRARALFLSDVPNDDPAVIGSGILAPARRGADAIERRVVASVDVATEAIAAEARRRGLSVQRAAQRFAGSAARLAARFTHELALGGAEVRVWGGESTVELPPVTGRGGRNQHLALAAAKLIAGYPDLLLLAAGSDGTDGPTEEAGGLVDGETCGRIVLAGLDPDESLRCADSGTALAAAGALVSTGPTGTNVADLVIGLKLAPGRRTA
jgi:glycerate 2-kinase